MVNELTDTEIAEQNFKPYSIIWYLSCFPPTNELLEVFAKLHQEPYKVEWRRCEYYTKAFPFLTNFIRSHPHDYVYVDTDDVPAHMIAHATVSTDSFLGIVSYWENPTIYWAHDRTIEVAWESGMLLIQPTGAI